MRHFTRGTLECRVGTEGVEKQRPGVVDGSRCLLGLLLSASDPCLCSQPTGNSYICILSLSLLSCAAELRVQCPPKNLRLVTRGTGKPFSWCPAELHFHSLPQYRAKQHPSTLDSSRLLHAHTPSTPRILLVLSPNNLFNV